MLLTRLSSYRVEPSEARRRAESLWNGLYWPGDIDAFHTLLRRAITAMRRVHMPQPDHSIVIKYLELIPREKAKTLEDPIRRPAVGWTTDALMLACKELFSIDRAYDGAAEGLPRQGQRQRAAWANDRKHMQTPLSLRAPPKTPPFSKPTAPMSSTVECSGCGGNGHKQGQCPNPHAKRDKQFMDKPVEARKKPCRKCGGVDHWAHHHSLVGQPIVPSQRALSQGPPKADCHNWCNYGACSLARHVNACIIRATRVPRQRARSA